LKKALSEEEETPNENVDVNINLIRKNLNCSDKSFDVIHNDPAGGGVGSVFYDALLKIKKIQVNATNESVKEEVCVSMCVYVYICIYVNTCIHMYIYMYICIYVLL
jgi:hypothetical protein